MLERFYITLGAMTMAGGKVTTANPYRTINDIPVAYEGDQVACPKCNSVGVIKPNGPRLSDTCDGKEVALSDDLCICKCSPPPRLLAAQDFACQMIDVDWHVAETVAAATAAELANLARAASAAEPDAIAILLRDPETNDPFKHRPYRLQLTNSVIEGTTDHNGATRPLSPSERASLISWHVDDVTAQA